MPRPVETDSYRRRIARRFPRASALVSAIPRREAFGSSSVSMPKPRNRFAPVYDHWTPDHRQTFKPPPWLCPARVAHPWQGADCSHAASLPHAYGKSNVSTPRMRTRRSRADRHHTGRSNQPERAVRDGPRWASPGTPTADLRSLNPNLRATLCVPDRPDWRKSSFDYCPNPGGRGLSTLP